MPRLQGGYGISPTAPYTSWLLGGKKGKRRKGGQVSFTWRHPKKKRRRDRRYMPKSQNRKGGDAGKERIEGRK